LALPVLASQDNPDGGARSVSGDERSEHASTEAPTQRRERVLNGLAEMVCDSHALERMKPVTDLHHEYEAVKLTPEGGRAVERELARRWKPVKEELEAFFNPRGIQSTEVDRVVFGREPGYPHVLDELLLRSEKRCPKRFSRWPRETLRETLLWMLVQYRSA
jgi:hypothetical protein